MFDFKCSYIDKYGPDIWFGEVEDIRGNDGYYHISILSRSKIFLILGRIDRCIFTCIPDFNAGCYLGRLDNVNYNTDKLTYTMKNPIDAITVAVALDTIRHKLVL